MGPAPGASRMGRPVAVNAIGGSELQRRDVIALLERSRDIGLDQTYMDPPSPTPEPGAGT